MKADEEKNFPLAEKELRRNKTIPAKYEKVILKALHHYPELLGVKIKFKLVKRGSAPYSTKPSLTSRLRASKGRTYIVSILERAKMPMKGALMRHMPATEQLGAIGHELAHVVQYESKKSGMELFKFLAKYARSSNRQQIERSADLATIEHGLGKNLLAHAHFIRQIPGYVEDRPEINKYYLLPEEIVAHLGAPGHDTKPLTVRDLRLRKTRAMGKPKRPSTSPGRGKQPEKERVEKKSERAGKKKQKKEK